MFTTKKEVKPTYSSLETSESGDGSDSTRRLSESTKRLNAKIIDPRTVDLGAGKKITEETYKSLKLANLWTKVPLSTYGTVVHSCITDDDEDFHHDVAILLLPTLITVIIQVAILYALIRNLENSPLYICTDRPVLVACTFFLLLVSFKSSLDDVLTEFSLITECENYVQVSSLRSWKVQRNFQHSRKIIALGTIFIECCITIATAVIGIYYLAAQTSVRFIVISSISVLFLTNVDNIMLENMLPACYRNEIADYEFELTSYPSQDKAVAKSILKDKIGSKVQHKTVLRYQLYYQAVMYALLAASVTYGFRLYMCGDTDNFFLGTDDQIPSTA